jgi:hypothetical protein
MVLSGSLHEFILADIFQLLSQQKATGKLLVTSERRSGFVILCEGEIVLAQEGRETLLQKFENFLCSIKNIPAQSIVALLEQHNQNLNLFSQAIVERAMLSAKELELLARVSIEDITCSLFSWTRGTYRFESLSKVEEYRVPEISLTTDSVMMEAMRRIDENKRLQVRITDNTIFVRSSGEQADPPRTSEALAAIVENAESYLLQFIDGLTPIGEIVERSCLSRYRIYETLGSLALQNQISALPSKLSQSIQAAMKKSHYSTWGIIGHSALSAGACAAVIAAMFFARTLLLLNNSSTPGFWGQQQMQRAQRMEQIASLQFHIDRGHPPLETTELVQKGYLSTSRAESD